MRERALLVGVKLPNEKLFEAKDKLSELNALSITAGASVFSEVIQNVDNISPSFFIGRGKAYEIRDVVKRESIDLVIFNNELKPVQQRNLENIINCKIIDRTGLILDIFAKRARTREGQLQVELAQLMYLLPRLTGKGVLLSRLGGGIGTRGPGEQKLEIDRRRIRDRISRLKKDIETVRKNRGLHRKTRQDVPLTTIAIVGYTNSGKSTILNKLTNANVLAEDKLFATLDPTTRKLSLPKGGDVLLTDTVGFIRDLPINLIAAFKATLEEVTNADLLLHIIDVANNDYKNQMDTVDKILVELEAMDKPVIMVFNKIDLLDNMSLKRRIVDDPSGIFISAQTGVGVDVLINKIEGFIDKSRKLINLHLPYREGKIGSIIHQYGNIISEVYTKTGITLKAKVDDKLYNRLKKYSR